MVKDLYDYVDAVQEKFPQFPKLDIIKILNFGLKRYIWANTMRCDVMIKSFKTPYIAFTGVLRKYQEDRFKVWALKWRMKERAIYLLKRKKWDGYYYIGVSEAQHKRLLKSKNKFIFKNCYPTKVIEELDHVSDKVAKYIWKVPYPIYCGWKFYVDKLVINSAEFVRENRYELLHKHV